RVLACRITTLPDYPVAVPRLVDAEALPAAAGGRGVRVLDREAAAGNRVDEVHLRAVQIADADRIDEQLDAVRLEHLIACALAVFLDHEAVLEPRASAALHEDAQPAAVLLLFGEQLGNLRSSRFGDINHATIIAGRCRTSLFLARKLRF